MCVIFSASLDSCPLVSVGDEVNFLQVNRGSGGHTHRHTDVAQWMYSSVKEHQVCVNTASSVCHMD